MYHAHTRNAGDAYTYTAGRARHLKIPGLTGASRRAVPRETVTAALAMLRDGQTIEATAAAVGVSKQTVAAWASGANCADVLREFEAEHGPLKLRRGPRPKCC